MASISILHRLHRLFWYSMAGTLILAAVAVTLARTLLPGVEGYRSEVERWASERLGQPVAIAAIDARLLGVNPTVIFRDVRLLDSERRYPLARFDAAHIDVDLIASLRQMQLVVAEVSVLGAELIIDHQADGRIEVHGLKLPEQAPAEARAATDNTIEKWLLREGRIAIRDSRLEWREHKAGERSYRFESVDIELHNAARRHQLNAAVDLPVGMGKRLRLALDVEGNVLRPKEWRGDLYLEAEDFRPSQWADLEFGGSVLEQGELDLKLWARWGDAELQNVVGEFALKDLVLSRGEAGLELERLASQFHWQHTGEGWALGLERFVLARAGRSWSPVRMSLSRAGEGWRLQASRLNLRDLTPVLPFVPQLEPAWKEAAAGLAPEGAVEALRVDYAPEQGLHLQARLDKVEVQAWENIPGVSGLDASLSWQSGHGELLIDSRQLALELPRLFRAPLQLDQLKGKLLLGGGEGGWHIGGRHLRLGNADLQAGIVFDLEKRPDASPLLALYGQFWNGHGASVPRYLPAHIMPEKTVEWLDQAFVAGTVATGGVLFHGRIDQFPFTDASGRFELGFRARDVELAFSPGWPHLKGGNAQVTFLNQGMGIVISSASLLESRVGQTRVEIDNLRRPLLTIEGAAQLSEHDGMRLLTETPLRERFAAPTEGLDLKGRAGLRLALAIPLSQKVAESRPFKLDGTLDLEQARLALGERLAVEAISGKLNFSETGLDSPALEGRLLGEPLSATVYTEQGENGRVTRIAGRGGMQVAALRRFYDHPLLGALDGASNWQGMLSIPHGDDEGGGPTELRLTSDLSGVAVALPAPLGKAGDEARSTSLRYRQQPGGKGRLLLDYGGEVKLLAQLERAGEGYRAERAALHFGAGDARLPKTPALRISGSLDEVDLAAWRAAWPAQKEGAGGSGPELPVQIEMERLHLLPFHAADEEEEGRGAAKGGALRQSSLPDTQVRIEHFGYGDMDFKLLGFRMERRGDMVVLRDLLLTGKALELKGKGRWIESRNRKETVLELELDSSDFGKMMKHLGFASVISKGKTRVEGSFQWPGSLADLSLATLGGKFHVKVEDGSMEDVEAGAGKLLGLLSLQALPRRLMLDFSDMFTKGFSFSAIEGDVEIRSGDAYTDDLLLSSPTASVLTVGRTGLVARDFDQHITVVPNVSGSVPVAGALAWGPQVGAMILLFQKLLIPGLDEAAKIEYTVTGSWEKPEIKRIEPEKSEDAETSPFDF